MKFFVFLGFTKFAEVFVRVTHIMKKFVLVMVGTIFALPLYAQDLPSQDNGLDAAAFSRQMSQRVKKFTLKNGIRVLFMQNGETPVVSAYIKFAVGSSNEPFNLAGTAHLLEHMLFKGTETLGTLDYEKEKIYLQQIAVDGAKVDLLSLQLRDPSLSPQERERLQKEKATLQKRRDFLQSFSSRFVLSEEDSMAYAQAGQQGYNAYTSTDVTNYQVNLPANRLELWAYLESSRFLKPILREFYSERKVVMEEKRMRYDSRPSAQLYQLFLSTAFGFSPYGKPVIGYASNIPVLTKENTENFFYQNYIPSRMVLTLVGKFDFTQTEKLIRKYFEKIPSRPLPPFPPIEQEPQQGKRTAYLQTELQASPLFITGWSKPSIFDKDHAAFEVLEKILSDGQTSRLTQRMVLQESVASSVGTYNGNPGQRLKNNFTIFVQTYKEEDYAKAEKILQEELKRLAEEGPDDEELERVKNNYLSYLLNSMESNAGLSDALSYYEAVKNNYADFFNNLEHIQKVSKEDIQHVIKTYFIDKTNTTVYLKRRLSAP